MHLRDGELDLLRQMVRELTGVALDCSKGYLVESRLGPVANDAGCSNFNELYFRLRYGRDRQLANRAVDAITTHETTFFRDRLPFVALERQLLPDALAARGPRRVRIWS